MTRAVLVTGGAAGIGWATPPRFAAAGDRVMIADIDAAAAEARAATLGPAHAAIGADIAAPETAARVVEACRARFGRLDVLVNNAGVIDSGGTMITDQPLEAFRRLLAINLLGMERMSRAAQAVMRDQAPPTPDAPRGIIVNLASGAAFRAIPLRNAYSASKAGVVAMTRAHGTDWARSGIRVNALAPGYIRTDLVAVLIAKGRVDPSK
ncbi:MAG: SDR family NAD(P)-dependent oxidoreductase, partial [Rhodospirillales bacterium]|nr:SDR family NAD(P)-dependent oxidoreductase [Rhodospirillales bacterium]